MNNDTNPKGDTKANNINLKGDTQDIIWTAAVLKSTEALEQFGSFAVWCLLVFFVILPFSRSVIHNHQKDAARMRGHQELVRECNEVSLVHHGVTNNSYCRTWANTKVRLYENY